MQELPPVESASEDRKEQERWNAFADEDVSALRRRVQWLSGDKSN